MTTQPMVPHPPAVAVGPVHIGERCLFTGPAVAAIWIAAGSQWEAFASP